MTEPEIKSLIESLDLRFDGFQRFRGVEYIVATDLKTETSICVHPQRLDEKHLIAYRDSARGKFKKN